MRTAAEDPAVLADVVRSAVWEIDSTIPVNSFKTLERVMSQSLWQPLIYAWLLGIFASVAMILAVIGTYGVVSYSVNQRVHEIGIRMALGASNGTVLKLLLREAMVTVLWGLALGLAGAVPLSGVLASLLPGVGALDPWLLLALVSVFAAVAAAAVWVPASRATRINPWLALRFD